MNERAPSVDDATMKFGLLMESAKAHQELAESQLTQLRAHTMDLDGVVRDEIRRTLVEELQLLTSETTEAKRALQRIRRGTTLRGAGWSVVTAVLCTVVPIALGRWLLPSEADVTALRLKRDELAVNVARLEQNGAKLEWRRCGESSRLCVRVDRQARSYGDKADFYIVAGY